MMTYARSGFPLRGWLALLLCGAGCDFLMVPGRGAQEVGSSNPPTTTATTRSSHETHFPIETGAHAMSDCNGCHGGFSTFKQFTCVSCHEHARDITDRAHAGVTDYVYDSSRCLSCHPTGVAGDLPRDQHTRFFPIDVGTPHAAGQCSECHTTPGDKKQFSCVSCHDHAQAPTDAAHERIPNYQYQSAACLSCHPSGLRGELARPDHKMFFPIEVGTPHGVAQCAECHTTPGDRKQFSCVGCHQHAQAMTDTDHRGIADYKYESPACYSCHPTGDAASISRTDHGQYFAIDVGSDHANTQCAECHTNPADKKVFTCFTAGCHARAATDSEHQGFTGYRYDAPTCLTCHPRGGEAELSRADHTRFFPINGGDHGRVQCATCHTNANDRSVFTCFGGGCHGQADMDGEHRGVAGYRYDAPTCLNCHRNGGD